MAPHHDTAMMEGLSRAYVRAVTVRAGHRYNDKFERDLGTDAGIDYIDSQGRRHLTTLQVGLKEARHRASDG
jgi:hypothetical protein